MLNTVAVVVAFFICWAPFHTQRLLSSFVNQSSSPPGLGQILFFYVSGVLYYVSAVVNPILYHIMSLKFRQAFKDTFRRFCCRRGHHLISLGGAGGVGSHSYRFCSHHAGDDPERTNDEKFRQNGRRNHQRGVQFCREGSRIEDPDRSRYFLASGCPSNSGGSGGDVPRSPSDVPNEHESPRVCKKFSVRTPFCMTPENSHQKRRRTSPV